MTPLKQFKRTATADECVELAEAAATTEDDLFNHLGRHREISVERARAIEDATREIAVRNGGITPVIFRDELVPDCAACPYACAARRHAEGA